MIKRALPILLLLSGPMPLLTAEPATETPASPFYVESRLPELARLLEQARENAPSLAAQELAQQESVARLDAAKAAYYPRLDLSSTIGFRTTTYDTTGVEDTDSAGANFYAVIRRPLYHWGAIEARISQARIDQANETLQRAHVLRQIRRGLRADYLTLLVNRAALENLRIRREISSGQLTRLDADQQDGRVSSIEAAQLNLNQEQTLIDIDAIENEQARILAAYQRQVGWSEPLALDGGVPELDAEALQVWAQKARDGELTEWVEGHAEMRRRRNQVEREKAELTWIKSRQRPLLNASASALRDQRNVANRNSVDAMTYFVGVDVSWNIFDGMETSARTREANLRLRRVERQMEAYRAELIAQSKDVLSQVILLSRQLQLNERRAKVTAEGYVASEREAAEGRLSQQALRERQLNSLEISLKALRSRVTLLLALNDYLDLTVPVEISSASEY